MKIIDIQLQPSIASVIAYLEDRVCDVWANNPHQPNQEACDVYDAIGICFRAGGYPVLRWDRPTNAWVPMDPQPPLNNYPKRF